MRSITKRIYIKILNVASLYIYKKKKYLKNNSKIVSFCFDDAPKSAYINGAKILESNGRKGTFYISFGLREKPSPSGKIVSTDDIYELLRKRHEIGCHTYSHIDVNEYKIESFKNDCIKNRLIANKEFGINLKSFSFPKGNIRPSAKMVISKFYNSVRTVQSGLNQNPIDIYALKSIPLYQRYGVEKPIALIEKLKHTGGWLIFYTHDVSDKPSDFGCDNKMMEMVVRKCIERDFIILTVHDTVQQFVI